MPVTRWLGQIVPHWRMHEQRRGEWPAKSLATTWLNATTVTPMLSRMRQSMRGARRPINGMMKMQTR